MNNKDSLLKLVKLRQIISTSKCLIGLYWLGSKNIIATDKQTLYDNIEKQKALFSYPQYLSVVKTHKKSWQEIEKNIKIINGGNPENNGWKSLKRGFVAFDTNLQKFIIVGGKWLDDKIAKKIAKECNLENYEIKTFPDYDNTEGYTDL